MLISGSRLRLDGLRSARAGPITLNMARGECLVLTGASGAGKSLLLRMIADLDPHDGEAWLDGRARSTMTPPEWRRRVVYVSAEMSWWLERAADHFPSRPPVAAALGLSEAVLDRPVSLCSTGERQRLALLRALALEPPVLLLDEPTAALDAAATDRVEALLRSRLATGTTIIVVSHDPAQAERLGARRARVRDGQLELDPRNAS